MFGCCFVSNLFLLLDVVLLDSSNARLRGKPTELPVQICVPEILKFVTWRDVACVFVTSYANLNHLFPCWQRRLESAQDA